MMPKQCFGFIEFNALLARWGGGVSSFYSLFLALQSLYFTQLHFTRLRVILS